MSLVLGDHELQSFAPVLGQWTADPVFGWTAAVALTIIMLASLWLTLTATDISMRGRLLLCTLRLLAIAVLMLGWFRPAFVSQRERELPGAIAVLMDRTESMTLPSGQGEVTRWRTQQDIWNEIVSSTNLKLGETTLVPYFYDSDLVPAEPASQPSLEAVFTNPPKARLTDIGAALAQVGRKQLDPPLRGVILIGDMTQTMIPAATDPAAAARQMAQLDQPILVVGVGAQSASQLRDVAIEGFPEEITAFAKKELRVPFVVSATGIANQEIRVQLILQRSTGEEQVLASKSLRASKAEEKLPIDVDVVLPDVGDYLIKAVATIDGQEQIPTNNQSIGFVTVRDGGVRVLYIEGTLRQEMTFLRRSLDESLEFEIDVPTELLLPSKGVENRPIDLDRVYDFDQYDAFIIGDLPASELTRRTQQVIKERVEKAGAGILFMGGFQSFSAGGYAGSELAKILPVTLQPGNQSADAAIDPRFHILDDVTLVPTRSHPVTRLALNAPDSNRIWAALPKLNQMNRLGTLRAVPGVQVLLESTDGQPAMVVGPAGAGRVMVFAGDTTSRWRLSGNKKVHQQFWRQALLWLVKKDSLNEGFRLTMERRRYGIDQGVSVSADWIGGSKSEAMPDKVKTQLLRDGNWVRDVASTVSGPGSRSVDLGGFTEPGVYTLQLTTDADAKYDTEIAFIVSDQSLELSNPSIDKQMLSSIASASSPAGGRQVLPSEISAAIDWLRERQDTAKVTTVERRRIGDTAWDSWIYLLFFVGLMCAEWALRKTWQLP